MNPTFPWGSDIGLFLNVINGTFILHNEDASILRYCLATYINCCMHFKTIFATSGYVWIIPTILRVYNLSQKNSLVTHAIECACKQFFILHRTPFILQLFGSIASSLDLDAKESSPTEFYKIKPSSLYRLLWSITEDTQTDALDILSMVQAPKPLKPVDFCYSDDPNNWNVLEAVSLCVTVVSYAPESTRAKQMICILQATFPFILRDLKKIAKQAEDSGQRDEGSKAKGGSELGMLMQLSTAVRQLLCNTDLLAKNARGFEGPVEKTSAIRTSSQAPVSVVMEDRDESPFKRMEEGRCGVPNRESGTAGYPRGDDDRERLDYITQREAYLSLTTEYFLTGVNLLADQFKGQERISDLLDAKSIVRVVDVAMNLLKLVPCDPHYRTEQRPLIIFICKVLPRIEWQQEALRVTLVSVLRRFDKLYREIEKKMAHSNRRMFNWDCLACLLDSVSDCLMRHRAVLAPVNHLKTLTNICIRIILYDNASMRDSSSSLGLPGSSPTHNRDVFISTGVPSRFSKSVIKLVSLLMNSTDSGTVCSLETLCHTDALFSMDKTAVMLGQFVLPLLLRCALQPEGPALSPANQRFALSLILNALNPRSVKQQQQQQQAAQISPAAAAAGSIVGGGGGGSSTKHLGVSERASLTLSDRSFRASLYSSDVVQRLALIGLKVMLVAYSRLIQLDCHRVAKTITEIPYGAHLWKFVDFLVTNRPPIYPHLLPYIKFRMMQTRCESQAEHALQALVGQRLAGAGVPPKRCVYHVLQDLAAELRAAKEESEPVRLRTASNASSMRPTGASFRRETSLKRNPSQRISAKDGSRCLQKYASTQNPNQQGLPVPSVDSLPSQGTLDEECELVTETEDDLSRIHRNDAKSRKTFKSWRGRQQRSQRRSQKSSSHGAGSSLDSSDTSSQAAASGVHGLPSPIPEGRLSEDRNQRSKGSSGGGGFFKFARHSSGRHRRVDSPLHVELASIEPSDAGSDVGGGVSANTAATSSNATAVTIANRKSAADNSEKVEDSENAAFLMEELIV
ncbi:hypothetical protein BOX15_Mlig002066g1 [Macrostomum lignano]|uniref:Protein UNC80 C-terminal domain-containing protein n=1 Tax=Macrostomum lignano TaxID=282301 RepID=A0A267GL07_9PLAT|nr:hypothetical protein BOX15_Mlig002066g1 [Macrostomum lignano]